MMNTFVWAALGAVIFTLLGWVAAILLWLRNADLEDQVQDLRDQLDDAHRAIVELRYQHARERLESIANGSVNVVPIRSAKP